MEREFDIFSGIRPIEQIKILKNATDACPLLARTTLNYGLTL